MAENTKPGFLMVGNHLCLDFVNTEIVDDGRRIDLMEGMDDFVRWSFQAGMISREEGERLNEKWKRSLGAKDFRELISFRYTIREIVESMAAHKRIHPRLIEKINETLRLKSGWYEVVKVNRGYQKRFLSDSQSPGHLMALIAESAAELLSSSEPVVIRKCENPKCILYFYDTSKNSSRRWCSMKGCGNRAKAAAYYERSKKRS